MWESDSSVDRHNLDREALNTAKLHHKYLSIYMDIKARRILLLKKFDVLRRDKESYYQGHATADIYKDKPFDVKVKTKAGIERYVSADPEIQDIQSKIEYADMLIEGVMFIMEQIKWRGHQIKNAIDWARFQSGGM